jgi:SAM-dependent methyltransferase
MTEPTGCTMVKSKGAKGSSIRGAIKDTLVERDRRTAQASSTSQPREVRAPIPLLVPQFWWLVLNTVRLKWQHRHVNPERYTDYLDRFYTGTTTRAHVAVYGDAYKDVRPLVADMAALTPGDTVLDVASGRGYQAAEFARRGHSVTSVELVHDRARTARDGHPGCHLTAVTGDAGYLPFKDGAFDVVVISLGLHCMPSETWLRVLREFSRVARKRVVILEPRAPRGWLLRHLYAAAGQILDESLYFWDFVLSDFDAHLARAGMELLELQRCFHQLLAVYVCKPLNRPVCRPELSVYRKPAISEPR